MPIDGAEIILDAPEQSIFVAAAASGGPVPSLLISWVVPLAGAPTSYNIYEGSASGAETLLATVPGTQTTYLQSSPPLGSRWLDVTAVYAGSESPVSGEVNVLVLPAVTFAAISPADIVIAVPALPPGIASFDLQRAVNLGGFPGAWVTRQAATAPSSNFDDLGLSKRAQYFYRLAATSAGGTTFYGEPSAAETTTMIEEQHFFSTGTMSATYFDANLGALATTPFAKLQGIDFNMDWAAHLLYDAAQIAVFPVDCAFHEGKFLAKVQHVGISADQVSFLAGLQLNVAGNPVIETINAVSFPEAASMTFTGQDTQRRTITITLNKVVSKGFSLPFKLADFAMMDVEFHAIADANGLIGTIAVKQ